jgi:hypothetical protein
MFSHFSSVGHLEEECYKETVQIEYAELPTQTDMSIYEIYYINKYKPYYNKDYNYDETTTLIKLEELQWEPYCLLYDEIIPECRRTKKKSRTKKQKIVINYNQSKDWNIEQKIKQFLTNSDYVQITKNLYDRTSTFDLLEHYKKWCYLNNFETDIEDTTTKCLKKVASKLGIAPCEVPKPRRARGYRGIKCIEKPVCSPLLNQQIS